ncbi:MAG: hypothetical protein QNK99_05355 [Burkholderiales bacterium]
MKNTLSVLFGLFIFISAASAEHHGHSAGKLSLISNGEFILDTVEAGDIKHTLAELKGLGTIVDSTYAPMPNGTVIAFECAGSNVTKNGESMLYALCLAKDKDGDQFSIENTRVGLIGVAGPGEGVMRGISGKFSDLMGTCTYVPTYMMNDGVFVSVAYECDMKH